MLRSKKQIHSTAAASQPPLRMTIVLDTELFCLELFRHGGLRRDDRSRSTCLRSCWALPRCGSILGGALRLQLRGMEDTVMPKGADSQSLGVVLDGVRWRLVALI